MTSREFNRKWNKFGITLEYNGYDLHETAKDRKWTMSIGSYSQAIWRDLHDVDETAERMIEGYAFIKEWNAQNPNCKVPE